MDEILQRKRVTLGVVMVTFLVALEATVVSTAMPKVVEDLGGMTLYAWVFSGYLTAMTLTGPIWGKLADRMGSKVCYLASTVLFLLGSTWAGCSHTMISLIGARIMQGLGGGGITPLGQVVLAQNHDLESRARVQGLLVAVYGFASIAGPPLGGYLVSYADWRWIFFLNLPFGLLGLVAVALFLPAHPKASPETGVQTFDGLGFLIFLLAYTSLLGACECLRQASLASWAGPAWILTALLLGLLWRTETRLEDPFFPVNLRHYPVFGRSFVLAPLVGIGVFGAISYLPLYFQGVLGQSPSESGHSMLPLLLSWTVAAGFAARVFLRAGTRVSLLCSTCSLTLAYAALCTLPTSMVTLLLCQIGIGLGAGLAFLPLTLSVQVEVPRASWGSATSAVVFLRMLGASLGTSLMGIFLPAQAAGDYTGPVLAGALQHAFVLGGVGAGLALVASWGLPRPPLDQVAG